MRSLRDNIKILERVSLKYVKVADKDEETNGISLQVCFGKNVVKFKKNQVSDSQIPKNVDMKFIKSNQESS